MMKSIKSRIRLLILACLVISVLVVTAFQIISLTLYMKQETKTNRAVFESYFNELTETMEEVDNFSQNYFYLNDEFMYLLINQDRYQYEYEIRKNLKYNIASRKKLFAWYVAESDRDRIISVYNPDIQTGTDLKDIDADIKNQVISGRIEPKNEWQLYRRDTDNFLIYVYRRDSLYLISAIKLSDFGESGALAEGGRSFVVFSDGDSLLENEALVEKYQLSAVSLSGEHSGGFWSKLTALGEKIPGSQLTMYLVTVQDYLKQQRFIIVILIILLVLLLFGVFTALYGYFRKLILYPVDNVVDRIENLEVSGGEYNEAQDFLEYQRINDSLNNLVHSINKLKEEKYEEVLHSQQAELQYYQLQTEPHFFLNCLKNIVALAESRQYEKIIRLTMAFSTHIRYIFRDNRNWVSLETELNDVEAYFQIAQMKTIKPMLLNMKVDPELLTFDVPILAIETFVENSIKHSLSEVDSLCITITVNRLDDEDGDRMVIQVEDNGKGFSDRAIEELNKKQSGGFISEKTGIRNLIRRTELFFEGDIEYAFYNRKNGGAVSGLTLPLMTRTDI